MTKVNYNLDKNGPRPSIRLCQEELRATVKRDSKGSVEFNDSMETYYVSNTEKGVRRAFMSKGTRNRLERNCFNCTFNLREEQVIKLIYNPDSSNRPIASEEQMIWLCQDTVRQQVCSNRIDLRGILGISIGTGQSVKFG